MYIYSVDQYITGHVTTITCATMHENIMRKLMQI